MKRSKYIIVPARLLLIMTGAAALFSGVWSMISGQDSDGTYFVTALTALVALTLTYIPYFIQRRDIMVMPVSLQTVFTLFTFCAMFFGEILHFYDRFFWWDSLLHLTSGLMFAMVGYLLFISLNRSSDVRSMLNPLSMVLFTVCFSLACGAVWEIFEFLADYIFGMNMQRWQSGMTLADLSVLWNVSNSSNPGLIDTMKDIVNDTVGTLLSIPLVYTLVRHNNKYVKPPITAGELLVELSEKVEAVKSEVNR